MVISCKVLIMMIVIKVLYYRKSNNFLKRLNLPDSFIMQISFPVELGCHPSLLMLANIITENN